MSKTVHAVYQDGVFRPVQSLDLPDPCEVEFEPRILAQSLPDDSLDRVYAVLSERYDGGEPDVAARHDQHQP